MILLFKVIGCLQEIMHQLRTEKSISKPYRSFLPCIDKVRNFTFPETKKAMRSFLGLINSLRRVIHLKILEDAHALTPLTSSTKPYKPTQEHRDIFVKVKEALVSQPLFNNLVQNKVNATCQQSWENNQLVNKS